MCGGATAVHTTSTANRCVRALCRLHIREILADASFRFYLGPMGGCVADAMGYGKWVIARSGSDRRCRWALSVGAL